MKMTLLVVMVVVSVFLLADRIAFAMPDHQGHKGMNMETHKGHVHSSHEGFSKKQNSDKQANIPAKKPLASKTSEKDGTRK